MGKDVSDRQLKMVYFLFKLCSGSARIRDVIFAIRSDLFIFLYLSVSVADPGCLSRIPDSKRFWIPDPDPHQRIEGLLTQKIVSEI
jgi:hypothetical protein